MDIFKEGKFELLALIETKLKGKGEVSWSVVNVVIEGRKEKKKKERGLDVRQGTRMVQDRSKWQGFMKGNTWGMNP